MPDARGDVLCPTCGQWTPPAPFCTECGAALQGEVRDALGGQGSDVFRRGREVDQPGTPWSAPGERFEPEPEDEAARAAAAARARAPGGPPIDHFAEPEPEPGPAPLPPAPAAPWPAEPGLAAGQAPRAEPPADETRSTDTPPAPASAVAGGAAAGAATAGAAAAGAGSVAGRRRRRHAGAPVEAGAPPPTPPGVLPPSPPPPPPRTYAAAQSDGGVSGLVFVLFLGLGILALLGGAILGGVFEGPTAEASPSPTAVAIESEEPTPEPTAEPTPGPSVAPTATPSASGPIEFPDGFIARAEACSEEPSGPTCDNSGAVNDGEMWVLVSFRHAQPTDVIGVSILDAAGDVDGESSLELDFCGESTDCAGWTFFGFDNLAPGGYTVRATRNGTLAATTSFTVE